MAAEHPGLRFGLPCRLSQADYRAETLVTEENGADPPAGNTLNAWGLAQLRQLANTTDSPVAFWNTLAVYLGGKAAYDAYDSSQVADTDAVLIPAWCAQYLRLCAHNIMRIADRHLIQQARLPHEGGLSPEAALAELPGALGFSRSGWNGFSRAVATWQLLDDWRMFDRARSEGSSYAEAAELVRKHRNLGSGPGDLRAASRRIKEGKALARALSEPTG